MDEYLLIYSKMKHGELLRPADWIDRLAEQLCSFEDRCTRYHPMLKPIIYQGERCLIMDKKLKDIEPIVFESVMAFLTEYQLKHEWITQH